MVQVCAIPGQVKRVVSAVAPQQSGRVSCCAPDRFRQQIQVASKYRVESLSRKKASRKGKALPAKKCILEIQVVSIQREQVHNAGIGAILA